MPVEEVRLELLPKRLYLGSIYPLMPEWSQIYRRLADHSIPADKGLVVRLGKEALALSESKHVGQLAERFRLKFIATYPPEEYRYAMYTRKGAIVVVNNPVRNGHNGNGRKRQESAC